MLKDRHHAAKFPKFYVMAVYQLLRAHLCSFIVTAFKIETFCYAAAFHEIDALFLRHFGDRWPGEDSHSLICAPLSAC